MPLVVGLLLVAAFIYLAENIGTLTNTWLYPPCGTVSRWSPVSPTKILSWYLLMQISFILIAVINRAHRRSLC